MAASQVLTKEYPSASGTISHQLASAERQAARLLNIKLQRLVERAAAMVVAPTVTLAVLDQTSQATVMMATYSKSFTGLHQANLNVHKAIAYWVTGLRAPVLIADLAYDPRARELGISALGSLLSVPLIAGQQALGALTITSPSINAFRQYHLRMLEMGADLGALAIFQARHLDAIAQQKEHLTILLEVSRGLATAPDARKIVSITVSAIGRLIYCEEAVVFRYDARTETLCGVAGLGTQSPRLAEVHIQVRDPKSVTAWVAQQRRPLMYTNEANGFIGLATETLLVQREMALLAVPLLVDERLWGVIMLARLVPFAPTDLRMMLNLSQMITTALAQ